MTQPTKLTTEVPCPCGTPVPVEVGVLLRGAAFACPGCRARLRLDAGSIPLATEVIGGMKALHAEVAERAAASRRQPLPGRRSPRRAGSHRREAAAKPR